MVISIISLLSSVVMINVQDAKKQASIASLILLDDNMSKSLADDLIAEWDFDSSIQESSGFGASNITLTGTEQYTDGIVGKAFDFNGATKIAVVPQPNGSLYNIGDRKDFTISFWYRSTYRLVNNAAIGPFMSEDPASGIGWIVGLSGGNISFSTRETSSSVNRDLTTSQGDLADGQWHHIIAVRDYTDGPAVEEIRLYIDGKLVKSRTNFAMWTIQGDGNFTFGYLNNYYKGQIDQFRIYESAYTQD